jgi:hypothetical protein
MSKKLGLTVLALALLLPLLCAARSYRLSPEDQSRFDSYYSRWLDYRRTNNHDDAISMERRMQEVMSRYGIHRGTRYADIASPAVRNPGRHDHDRDDDRWGRDRGRDHDRRSGIRMSADDERRFRSYYSRWEGYRRSRQGDEARSMEARMDDIKRNYGISPSVSYHDVMRALDRR